MYCALQDNTVIIISISIFIMFIIVVVIVVIIYILNALIFSTLEVKVCGEKCTLLIQMFYSS